MKTKTAHAVFLFVFSNLISFKIYIIACLTLDFKSLTVNILLLLEIKMKQKIRILSALALAVLASGCSTVDNHLSKHVEKEPTLGSLKWSSNDSKIYLRTMYVQADFNENGDKRLFADYDYTMESSPCTTISKYSPRTNIYSFQHKGESLSFECRPYFNYDKPDERRLYLLGSTRDCEDRQFDYKIPVLDSGENTLEMCNKIHPEASEKIQQRYQDWLKAGVFK